MNPPRFVRRVQDIYTGGVWSSRSEPGGGARAGCMALAVSASPVARWERILSMPLGASMQAMMRNRPPHLGAHSMSMGKSRRGRCFPLSAAQELNIICEPSLVTSWDVLAAVEERGLGVWQEHARAIAGQPISGLGTSTRSACPR